MFFLFSFGDAIRKGVCFIQLIVVGLGNVFGFGDAIFVAHRKKLASDFLVTWSMLRLRLAAMHASKKITSRSSLSG